MLPNDLPPGMLVIQISDFSLQWYKWTIGTAAQNISPTIPTDLVVPKGSCPSKLYQQVPFTLSLKGAISYFPPGKCQGYHWMFQI